ncbi:DUF2846 domain-containing protein [Hahella sp. NBU794]|uniref:DUF2846 domain-containing protein n=1 Tax=Hahella sp. NBU794 TaxID=3422590 RepID=UPI003D6F7A9B
MQRYPSLRTLVLLLVTAVAMSGCKIYQSMGKSVGAFVHPVSGPKFVHIPDSEWDSASSALIYFYRPHSDWASEEIESPSVYVDDSQYFNFRDNSYTWLQVAPGERRITMRRPLLGFEGIGGFTLSDMTDQILSVDAGKIYYLRYSEISKPDPNPEIETDSPWAEGDLQLVAADFAYNEIVETRFLNSDLLAPNHAATSIVKENIEYSFEREQEEIEVAREEEIERLKEQGYYRPDKWWCMYMCGGGPTKRLKTDRMQRELDKRKNAYEEQLAESESSSWWWPF